MGAFTWDLLPFREESDTHQRLRGLIPPSGLDSVFEAVLVTLGPRRLRSALRVEFHHVRHYLPPATNPFSL